jgi:hypothetical protein
MTDQPTTFFTLPAAVDEIRSIVEGIQTDRTTFIVSQIISLVEQVIAAQAVNALAVADIIPRISDLDNKLSSLISDLGPPISTLEVNIANLVTLVEATLQALSGVSTSTLQQLQIDLLNKILQSFSANLPASIDLDLARKTTAPQTAPTKAGP